MWVRMNSFHVVVVLRVGAGGRPWRFRMLPVWSKNSCGFTHVVFEEPPEPFSTVNCAFPLAVLAGRRKEQHVALALMMPLVVKILHVLRQRMTERCFPAIPGQ
jgi:hypothetical protein